MLVLLKGCLTFVRVVIAAWTAAWSAIETNVAVIPHLAGRNLLSKLKVPPARRGVVYTCVDQMNRDGFTA